MTAKNSESDYKQTIEIINNKINSLQNAFTAVSVTSNFDEIMQDRKSYGNLMYLISGVKNKFNELQSEINHKLKKKLEKENKRDIDLNILTFTEVLEGAGSKEIKTKTEEKIDMFVRANLVKFTNNECKDEYLNLISKIYDFNKIIKELEQAHEKTLFFNHASKKKILNRLVKLYTAIGLTVGLTYKFLHHVTLILKQVENNLPKYLSPANMSYFDKVNDSLNPLAKKVPLVVLIPVALTIISTITTILPSFLIASCNYIINNMLGSANENLKEKLGKLKQTTTELVDICGSINDKTTESQKLN